jgi:hypothetical protein
MNLINYFFSSYIPPLTYETATGIERAMLSTIDKNNLKLQLFKTKGLCSSDFGCQQSINIYRLADKSINAYANVMFEGQDCANILMCNIFPPVGYFALRDFIKRVLRTLFDSNEALDYVMGYALSNSKTAGKRRSSNQLLRLWVRCGFEHAGQGNALIIRRETFFNLFK